MGDILEFLQENIVFSKTIASTDPQCRECKFTSEKINNFLRENSINLYSHQVQAIEEIRNGKNVIITTPTASGKSMIYMLSILEKIEQDKNTKAIVVFPLNALARDQKYKIENLIKKTKIDATVESYYGDTPKKERAKIRENPPNILITTPDMLNQGILPHHYLWKDVYRNLEFVVIDEIHAYKGVLGSHVANIFRRLNRLSMYYQGKLPRYICNSATIRNPIEFAEKLTKTSNFVEISKSGAPSPEKVISIVRSISDYDLIDFIISNLVNKTPTLVFIDSRKGIELLYLNVIKRLSDLQLNRLANKIRAYRAGYQEHERREIEDALAKGDVLVVLSTGALEMGIDIGEVDCVIVRGFPGTLAALWQRFGRAGRRGKTAYNYFIAGRSAIDQYYLKNPEEMFNREVEEPVISPGNKEIFKKHLVAMARELPIMERDIKELDDQERQVLNSLIENEIFTVENNIIKLKEKINPFFAIRSIGGVYKVVDIETNKKVGELSEEQVFREGYKGATYIHLGKKYTVIETDRDKKVVYVKRDNLGYYTRETVFSEVFIVNIEKRKKFKNVEIEFGNVKVSSKIVSYKKVDMETGKAEQTVYLDIPIEKTYNTKAFWIKIPSSYEETVRHHVIETSIKLAKNVLKDKPVGQTLIKSEDDAKSALRRFLMSELFFQNTVEQLKLSGKQLEILTSVIERFKGSSIFELGLYGLENAITSIFPIFVMNDRRDIDSASEVFSLQTKSSTVFIFDAYEGGLGYAEVGFERIDEILGHAYKNVRKCRCISGCPTCVLSYKYDRVDKLAAEYIFRLILNRKIK
ncbi:MAG: DEAD/DEAH box helicase [Sulfurihydrogenibium sp.]|nr:DEAD/DEAH box helicase [Sulfurihydrogenibium sp.]